jgi:hypothetical protein
MSADTPTHKYLSADFSANRAGDLSPEPGARFFTPKKTTPRGPARLAAQESHPSESRYRLPDMLPMGERPWHRAQAQTPLTCDDRCRRWRHRGQTKTDTIGVKVPGRQFDRLRINPKSAIELATRLEGSSRGATPDHRTPWSIIGLDDRGRDAPASETIGRHLVPQCRARP